MLNKERKDPWQKKVRESNPNPKKELTSTALVLSSTGVESSTSVSGMSAQAFLATKNAWKKTNLEKKKIMCLLSYKVEAPTRSSLGRASPSQIHDQVLLPLHMVVVDDGAESGNEPLPQSEY